MSGLGRALAGQLAHRRARMCTGKRRYASQPTAAAALARIGAQHPSRARGLNPYRCDFCHCWHLGHASSTAPGRQRNRGTEGAASSAPGPR